MNHIFSFKASVYTTHVCIYVCLLPSSVKPQLQPQLPAEAKLAELQPYFVLHDIIVSFERDLREIFVRFARDLPEICLRFV